METVQTLIEFVKAEESLPVIAQTGDISSLCWVVLVCVFALASVCLIFRKSIFRMTSNNSLKGNTRAVFANLSAVVAITVAVAISIVCAATIGTAFASNSEKAQASDKVVASVNEDTGEVTIDNGYLKNIGIEDLYVIEVNVEYLDDIKIEDQCTWQVNIDNQSAYNNVAGVPSKEVGIKVGYSETEFKISNLSAQTAKALVGKTVAKVTFAVDNFNTEQVKAFEALDKSIDEVETSISQIPSTQLLDEDRELFINKINKLKENYELKIANTQDADELQAILTNMKGDAGALVAEANNTAKKTELEKEQFISSNQQKAADLKSQLSDNIWLSVSQKSDFVDEIDAQLLNNDKINNTTSRSTLDSLTEEITLGFERIDKNIKDKTSEEMEKLIAAAKAYVDGSCDTVSELIDDIDNLTTETKSTYKSSLITLKNTYYEKFDSATSPTEIETFRTSFVSEAIAILDEADAKAHRPWTLETWLPETTLEISANSSCEIDSVAEVSTHDPFKANAPGPTYFIDGASNNVGYFSIETTIDHKANIKVVKGTPEDIYTVIVYAQFGNVPDKGYVTNSNYVALTVTVTEEFAEVELDNSAWGGYPKYVDDWEYNDVYVLSDGGTEILNAGGQVGYYVNFYFSSTDAGGVYNLQIHSGHWDGMIADLNYGSYDPTAAGGGYSLLLTDEIFNRVTSQQSWGGSFILHGDNVICTKITLSSEKIFNP